MDQVARHTLFGVIRMLRRAGFVLTAMLGVVLIGLVMVVTTLSSPESQRHRGEAFAADRPVSEAETNAARGDAPWSRVIGGRDFDTITDATEIASGGFVFSGLSLAMEGNEGSSGLLIRTDRRGEVEARHDLAGETIGRIAKITLDEDGGSRIVHWLGADIGFARSDAQGRILWSRRFAAPSDIAWGDVAAGADGHTLIAIAEGNAGGQVRLARLDGEGKVLWRHDLDSGLATADLKLAAAGEGGALLALASRTGEAEQTIALRRFDSRGRLVWQRRVYSGRTARLADARLDSDRVGLLVAGEPAGLFVYDTFGTPVWVREIRPLSENGRHVLARAPGLGYQVVGEPRHGPGQLWLARYGEDGQEAWTRSRANRTHASFESVHVTDDGLILAGGSLTDPLMGNTDMLMMRLSPEGGFPGGYDSLAAETGLFASRETETETPPVVRNTARPDSNMIHAATSSRLPVLAASVIVDEVVAEAERQARAGAGLAPPTGMADTPGEAHRPAPTRQVAAEVQTASVAVSRTARTGEPVDIERPDHAGRPSDAGSQAPQAPATPEAELSRPSVSGPETGALQKESGLDTAARSRARPDPGRRPGAAPARNPQAASFAYRCTFTCLAEGEDAVKYPVDRVIRDVSENNAGLVALDVLAMDKGVCLASGGRVFESPRLPPVCERVE